MGQFETFLNYVFWVVGPCLIVYSIVSAVRTRSFIRRSAEADGEVVRLERSRSRGRYGYTYAPVFTFIAANGETYTVESDVGTSPAGFEVGDPIRVRYDPAHPNSAKINTFFQVWGTAVVYAIVGVAFTCFAIFAKG